MGFIGVQPASAPLTSSDIADGVVTKSKIANDAVDNTKLDLTDDYAFTGTITGAGQSLRPDSKPLIINGDMSVAQRGTSSSGLTSSSYNTVDRFKTNISSLGTWTETQERLSSGNAYINGFANALKIDCTTADGSPASSDRLYWSYRFEGQDLQLLKKGTANAEKITIAFWIKATKTGTNILELYDNDNSRAVSTAYTVSSSNTWEHKVVNFPADTTGALGDDNGGSLYLFWYLGAGTDYTSGTLQTTWASITNANRVVGQVNHGDNTSNNVHLTGVQMEVGEFSSTTLPSFQHESFGENLARCQWYFYNHADRRETVGGSGDNERIVGKGGFNSSSQFEATVHFPVTMRVAPSLVLGSGTNYFKAYVSGTTHTFDDFAIHADHLNAVSLFKSGFSGIQGEAGNLVLNNSNAFVHFNSEL